MRLKKHLRGRKSPIRLFAFLCFSCAFCAFFVCKTSKKKKIACLTFYAFVLFMLFYAFFMRIKKHLSESRLFAFYAFCTFLYFFMFFVLFCACRIFSWKRHEITLIPHLYYYSFSIQLKCPTRLKIQPRFSWVYAQFKQDCAISENGGEKVGGKKKADLLSWNFNSQSDYQQLFSTWFTTTKRHMKFIQDFLAML